ncbi:uncharacterized protein CCOS01_13472 [Colletotrichum costaricense]|uniref:Uncharacterized protein n=1 Tax=Colletotrichum costaricense TaxID=1209916 RepID=A0AAI9YM15_9PEZI|nr:uncharacterized protein CCOS01_13472 [Colletotrichum costaricense]KAK1515279.1 hypothetical protein CCOS01_13472 [Colletotrichum costaricense]
MSRSPPSGTPQPPGLQTTQPNKVAATVQRSLQTGWPSLRISAALGPVGHRRRQQSEKLRIPIAWARRRQTPKWRHVDTSTNRSPAFVACIPGKGLPGGQA